MRLENKIGIVTAAASGMGRAGALRFAREGAAVGVADIDAAAQRVRAGGGRILEGPFEAPGGSWIARCIDPQGAMFALEAKRGRSAIGYFERVAPRDPSDPRGRRWYW